MRRNKIYYAHSMSLYNTPQEQRDIKLLENLGFEVVNPNDQMIVSQVDSIKAWGNDAGKTKDEVSAEIMDFFFKKIIPNCDALAYRSFIDHKIGAGVWGEINCAQVNKIPIIELPTLTVGRMLDISETRNYLKLLGER
jgi:hypothetical protein